MAKKTFVVTHPKLYMKVKGRLAHVEKGTEVSLDEKHAESLLKQGKVLVQGKNKTVDVGGSEKKLTATQKKKLESEVEELTAKLAASETEEDTKSLGEALAEAKAKLEG